MERLTTKSVLGGWTLRVPRQEAVNRLAAYEDSGLAPDDLSEAAVLLQAKREGRCVVLDTPRKPLVWGDDGHNTCLCPDCGRDLMGIPYGERMVLQCPVCGQYVDASKALTRAEAEAALSSGHPLTEE